MSFDLGSYLSDERSETELALAACLRGASDLPAWAVPVIEHGVLSGGKRIRPILCVAAYRAARPGAEVGAPLRQLSCALELIHAYSLMHDDLPCMDDAALRRGRPTPHTVYGELATLRAAAMLIPLAARVAARATDRLSIDRRTCDEIVNALLRAAGAAGMVGGQWLDLEAEGKTLSEKELTRVHALKTGALLTAALRMGGLAAGADDRQLAGLVEYGAAVGLAFQIADDVLDRTGDPEALGKRPSDVELEKSTYASVHGLDTARRHGREQVERALAALEVGGIRSTALEGLATYIFNRDR